ncbi:DUF7365 family protein [Staphylococcus delphini]|uniref:DUF7365 family protein n=1 Tax=Staphylococcus delphini TaxID=53344 RepID=UPI000BBBF273|nr:hypothetical protein [Staphylococcus delphini]PCF44172.1 hypothetical protein B5C06_01090 [Staphylococcus delphini]
MENAIITWIATTALPIATFVFTFFHKTKESERRITLIEADNRHIKDNIKTLSDRVVSVENSQIVLGRIDERLNTLSEQTKTIQDDVKVLQQSIK